MKYTRNKDDINQKINWSTIDKAIVKIGYNYNIFTIVLVSDNVDDMNAIKSGYSYCIEVPGNHRLVEKYARTLEQHYSKLKAGHSIHWESRDICIFRLYSSFSTVDSMKKSTKSDVDYDEHILCAAVRLKKDNSDQPIILGGYRHADCFGSAIQLGYTGFIDENDQGFLTSKGRFVDRTEALTIARRADQLNSHHPAAKFLISDDLY